MDPRLADGIGPLIGAAAMLATTTMESKKKEEEQAERPPVAIAQPESTTVEKTFRESVGGTVTETTKNTSAGTVTETTTVTKKDGSSATSTTVTQTAAPAATAVSAPPENTVAQNETGKVGFDAFGNVAVQVDNRDIAREGEEGRCILIQLICPPCGRPQWLAEWQEGIFTDLTADDFYDILDQKNEVLMGCCPPCASCGNEARAAQVQQSLNQQYAQKNITMRAENRTVMVTNMSENLKGNPNAYPVTKYYFIIAQK